MAQYLTADDCYLTEEQIEMISHAAAPETAEAVDTSTALIRYHVTQCLS
jgi:hypothetical protein